MRASTASVRRANSSSFQPTTTTSLASADASSASYTSTVPPTVPGLAGHQSATEAPTVIESAGRRDPLDITQTAFLRTRSVSAHPGGLTAVARNCSVLALGECRPVALGS